MKSKLLIAAALLAMSGTASPTVFSHYISVNFLTMNCESKESQKQSYCEMFLLGVVDTINAFTFWGRLDKKYICIGKGVDMFRLRKVYVGYVAAENPDSTSPAASVAIRAFGKAFPCE